MAQKKKATKKKGAPARAKAGTRKLTGEEKVDFTALHKTLKQWTVRLNKVRNRTDKLKLIQDAIADLRDAINCQSTMVIGF